MKRLLVTGLDGFVGGFVRHAVEDGLVGARYKLVEPERAIELLDSAALCRAVEHTRPDLVLHLAAQSFVPNAVNDPHATYKVNFFGTLNLLEALQAAGFSGRMLYVSSGEVYGLVAPDELPISETYTIRPRNPYSVSKAAAELLCYQWTQTHAFDIVVARPFNHIGPGQADQFAVPAFARQIIEAKLGLHAPLIKVGSIDVTRDFTDVRDVVRAYFLLLERGRTGEVYNVCSGKEHTIRSLLERMISLAGVECRIAEDRERVRPNEQKRMRGTHQKLSREMGWGPLIEIEKSLNDVLTYWENRLKHA